MTKMAKKRAKMTIQSNEVTIGENEGKLTKSPSNEVHIEDVGSLLHGDDSELILFVNPCKESLCFVMEVQIIGRYGRKLSKNEKSIK